MSRTTSLETRFEEWSAATGISADEVVAAWQELVRRGLAADEGEIKVSPLAPQRAASDAERRLASHLAGYQLTENSFIVRRSGDSAGLTGLPSILNTRITVEQIAGYFKDGWGVLEIERDLPILTREQIEAAIQYYLNHRAEIEGHLERSRELYETHAPKSELTPA